MITATKPLPSHYESVQHDALDMGWDVERTTTSLKIVPPRGSNLKPFSFSLTNVLPVPVLQKQLADLGFLKSVQAWEREQKAQQPPVEPAKEQKSEKPHVCPECAAKGVEARFERPNRLGLHRRQHHGVEGKSKEAMRRRGVSAKKRAAVKKTSERKPSTAAVTDERPTESLRQATEPVPAQPAAPAVETVDTALDALREGGAVLSDRTRSALAAFVYTIARESAPAQADNERLRRDNERLRAFRDEVIAMVSDGTKPPVQVMVDILDLAKRTDR